MTAGGYLERGFDILDLEAGLQREDSRLDCPRKLAAGVVAVAGISFFNELSNTYSTEYGF